MVAKKKKQSAEENLSPEEEQIIQQTIKAEKDAQPHKTGIFIDRSTAADLLARDLRNKQKYPHIKDLQTTEEDNPKKLMEWATENNIDPLYFATSYEEYLKGDNKIVQKLKELKAENPDFTTTIAEPFMGIPEADIAKMAKDEGYEVDDDEQQDQEAQEEGR